MMSAEQSSVTLTFTDEWIFVVLLQKRVTNSDTPTGDMADLFEEISNAKRKAWLDMDDSGKKKYEKLAEG